MPTPEPNPLILAGTGLFGLFLLRRKFIPALAAVPVPSGRGKSSAAILAIGVMFLLASAKPRDAQSVTLAVSTSPSSGTSGASAVSITGSGFPSGTIPAADATVTVASACGVSGTTTAASSITKIIGTSERIQFVILASLSSGTYYVSLSGSTSTGTAFSSANCAQVSVEGGAPIASLSVPSITFPNLTAGSSSPTQTVNLSNPGSVALSISNIGISGTGSGLFSESNNCGTSVASGSFCTITVGFNPLVAASYTAVMTITDNASPTSQTVTLNGTPTTAFISGKVSGGQQPIGGAAVTLWAAGTSNTYGAGATSIATTTGSNGSFSFDTAGASLCTTGQSLYITSVMGAVREVSYMERAQAVADVYRELTAEQHRNVLVVAPTHEEIGRVTQAIREDLKQRALLGAGETLNRHIPLHWTEAQKKDLSNYQPDQVLVFHRASRGIEKHEALTVTHVSGSGIHAVNERGEEESVSLTQARSFSVHERMEIEVAVGDKLLMMGNRKEPGFRATNGELTIVRSVERGVINLEDGRTVPANYRDFTHGYAVTAHRSQGKTVDHVVVSADVMKQELFYVAASRGREGITVITSDVERLGESLGVSMARPSAIELANDIAQQKMSHNQDIAQGLKQEIKLPIKIEEIGFEMGLGL